MILLDPRSIRLDLHHSFSVLSVCFNDVVIMSPGYSLGIKKNKGCYKDKVDA